MVDPWMLCGNGWGLSGRYHGWPCQGLTNMTCAECWSSHWKPPRTRHRATENLKVVESIITTVVIHTRCYKHHRGTANIIPECGMSSSPLIGTAASHYTTLRHSSTINNTILVSAAVTIIVIITCSPQCLSQPQWHHISATANLLSSMSTCLCNGSRHDRQ